MLPQLRPEEPKNQHTVYIFNFIFVTDLIHPVQAVWFSGRQVHFSNHDQSVIYSKALKRESYIKIGGKE